MRSWLFRRRHQLRALYGLPPERRQPRLQLAAPAPAPPAASGASSPEGAKGQPSSGDQADSGWVWPRRRAR